MAMVVAVGDGGADADRRPRIFEGQVFCIPPTSAVRAMAEFAWELITAAFEGMDPSTAHTRMAVEDFVRVLGPLKTGFTHHPHSKELLRDVLVGFGCDPTMTYFDVPKLRVVTPASYLTAGLGYNYMPHRDTWYSAPQCQVNWWVPIRGVTDLSCMAFHPDFWQREAPNSSADFDAYEWNRSARRDAATFIKSDPRPHPRLVGDVPGSEIRLVGDPGSALCFSGAHLHSTVPSTVDHTRFSFDFRTVHIDDIAGHEGPANIDSLSTGTTLRDFLQADSHVQLPDELIAEYDKDGNHDGVLVFDPSVLETEP
ncbi:MAG: hypothetical protein ABI658_27455 [Acidimicrobiales bacterium]